MRKKDAASSGAAAFPTILRCGSVMRNKTPVSAGRRKFSTFICKNGAAGRSFVRSWQTACFLPGGGETGSHLVRVFVPLEGIPAAGVERQDAALSLNPSR